MFAAGQGAMQVVSTLIAGGADPSLKNNYGQTAQMEAEWKGHHDVAMYLEKVSVKHDAAKSCAAANAAGVETEGLVLIEGESKPGRLLSVHPATICCFPDKFKVELSDGGVVFLSARNLGSFTHEGLQKVRDAMQRSSRKDLEDAVKACEGDGILEDHPELENAHLALQLENALELNDARQLHGLLPQVRQIGQTSAGRRADARIREDIELLEKAMESHDTGTLEAAIAEASRSQLPHHDAMSRAQRQLEEALDVTVEGVETGDIEVEMADVHVS